MELSKTIAKKSIKNDNTDSQKILIVEDDDVSFFLLEEIFALSKFQLTRAFNGQEAIDYFHKNKYAFDIILMDIRLPKINGYEATQKIKALNPSIPIIAVTAYTHSQGVLDCFAFGCDDFISKPFNINTMINTVDRYLSISN